MLFASAGVQIPIVNSDFETLYKPGSTTVTAGLPAASLTSSFGPGASVSAVPAAGGAPVDVSYSDGTTGTTVDIPGWTIANGATAGVENNTLLFPVKHDNFAYVRPNPDPSAPNPLITQTLTGFSLKPNTTYVLTFDTGTENQTSPNGGPIFGILLVNGTPLGGGVDGSSTSPFPGCFVRDFVTYVTGNTPPAGPVSIELGIDAPITATAVDFDNVTLTEIPGTGGTPPRTPQVAVAQSLSAPDVTASGVATQTVTATYVGGAGVATGSLFPGNIQVLAPNGIGLEVTAVHSTPATGEAPIVTATYTVAAPFGTFTSADNGTYTIVAPGGNISDANTDIANDATATFNVSVGGGPTPGTTDPTWVGGGAERLDFTAASTAVQSDGRILVAGLRPGSTAGTSQSVLERLNANGTPDTTFGANGTVFGPTGPGEAFYAVAVQGDGKILAAGGSGSEMLLERFDATGAADPTFGTGGRMTASRIGPAVALGLGLNPTTGDIDVAGTSDGQAAVVRFTPTGDVDTTFGNNSGFAIFDLAPAAAGAAGDSLFSKVVVNSDGSIFAAGAAEASGSASGPVLVARITAAGVLTNAFNAGGPTPGVVVVPGLTTRDLSAAGSGAGSGVVPDATEGLAVQSVNGQSRILVANRTADGHFGIVRLNPSGSVDTTFGSAGLATVNFGGDDDADFVAVVTGDSTSVAGTPVGDLFVAGTTTAAPTTGGQAVDSVARVAIAALTPDGSPDPAFAGNGREVFDSGVPTPASTGSAAPGVARPGAINIGTVVESVFASLQADGRVLVGAGRRTGGAGSGPLASVRRVNPVSGPSPVPTPTPTPPTPLPVGTLGAGVAAPVPASAVSGSKVNVATTVTVRNPTNQTVSGRVTVTLYVSPQQSLDGAAELTAATRVLKLKAGQSRAIKLRISRLPSGLSSGNYFVTAAVRAPDGTTTAVTGPSFSIAAPFVAAKVSAVRPVTASASAGRPATLALTLTDAGTAPAAGTAAVTVSLSPQSSGNAGQSAAPVPLKVKLAPKGVRTYRVKFVVPAGVAAGRYFLTASLDVAALGDTTAADGTGVSTGTLLVK